MKKNILLRTNIIVCAIITIGFILTSYVSYRSNVGVFEQDIERVSTLAAGSIYHQITGVLSKPVSVARTMAGDVLLKDLLSEEAPGMGDSVYAARVHGYLNAYREKYGYDSVYLLSSATDRYYHFSGQDRQIRKGSEEDRWFFDFLEQEDEYFLNVDNDLSDSSEITIFVNCKIVDANGRVMGLVGVGLKAESFQKLLADYGSRFGVNASLVNSSGIVQVSPTETGYEGASLFDGGNLEGAESLILQTGSAQEAFWHPDGRKDCYVVAQYIPELEWSLVVEKDTAAITKHLQEQFAAGVLIVILIITLVLVTITKVIRHYNTTLTDLTFASELEYQKLLHEATEGLYENIFELNITGDRACGEGTKRYFESLGISGDTSYLEALKVIAKKQIKEEFIQGYLETFSPAHVLQVFASGANSLSYDFQITNNDQGYHWMRITARIFYWASDQSVHLISYRMNIDTVKKRELSLVEQSQRDSLTNLYNKRTTEELITRAVAQGAGNQGRYVFLIFDIDNFKTVNDTLGHSFGDSVIREFSRELQAQFRDTDIVGRIGGDEFAVLMKEYRSADAVREKMERFCSKLNRKDFGREKGFVFSMSVGAALFPEHGGTYAELYEKADQALYFSKGHGKGSFRIYGEEAVGNTAFQADQRDLNMLVENATDGISKIAFVENAFKLLYFNHRRTELTGTPISVMSSADYNVLDEIHPDDVVSALQIFRAAVPTRNPFTVYYRLRHHNGEYIPVRLKGLFVNEVYFDKYPIFYAAYTDMREIERGENKIQ